MNAVSGLVTDMRGDPKWGAVGLVGFFLQLVGALLRTFDPQSDPQARRQPRTTVDEGVQVL